MFLGCERLTDLYLPASLLPTDFLEWYIDRNVLIYAPESSYALQWAMDQGYDTLFVTIGPDAPSSTSQ